MKFVYQGLIYFGITFIILSWFTYEKVKDFEPLIWNDQLLIVFGWSVAIFFVLKFRDYLKRVTKSNNGKAEEQK